MSKKPVPYAAYEKRGQMIERLQAEVERLTAELFAAELRAKTYEEGYNESQEAMRYHQARVEALEGVRAAAKQLVSVHKPKDFAPCAIKQADKKLREALAATEQGDRDE